MELCRDAGRMLELPSADFGSASDDGAGRCAALVGVGVGGSAPVGVGAAARDT